MSKSIFKKVMKSNKVEARVNGKLSTEEVTCYKFIPVGVISKLIRSVRG